MFELKNAYKNVKRNRKRYVIVGILIFIISLISVVALIVNQSAQTTIDSYLNEYGAEATIDIDPEQMVRGKPNELTEGQRQMSNRPESLTYEDYEKIAQSEYVQGVEYEQTTNITTEEITALDTEGRAGGYGMKAGNEEDNSNSFTILGSDSLENSAYFENDLNIIIEGDYPQNDNEIVINTQLAEENSLTIGDSIKFTNSVGESQVSLKIVGIYENVSQDQLSMQSFSNMLFSTYSTISKFTDEKTNITAKYTLTSYEDAKAFEQELYDNGLDQMYYVNNNQELLNQVLGPVTSTINLLNNMMIVTFIVGGAILIFINLLILRERKYEIGVLRALGQKKSKIIQGFLIEIMIVTIIAMLIAIIVGIFFAQPISDILMASSLSSDIVEKGPGSMGGGHLKGVALNNSLQAVTSIQTVMNIKVLVFTSIVNLLLILLTTLVSTSFVTKQQPNEILRER